MIVTLRCPPMSLQSFHGSLGSIFADVILRNAGKFA